LDTGNFYRIGVQCYPANDRNGRPGWGQIRLSPVGSFDLGPECLQRFEPLFASGLVRTSNANGIPDSIRIILSKIQECFAFGVTTQCSPTTGLYWDNVSLAIRKGGFNISIDARDTSPQAFRVDGGGCLDGSQVQVVSLGQGAHRVQQCFGPGQCRIRPSVEFTVDNAGEVGYDAVLESLLDGAGSSALTVHAYAFPPRGDDVAASMGQFRIVVDPGFWSVMDGYPGYGVVNGLHRLVSPVLYDPQTKIGRSSPHLDGDASDVNGTPVGLAMTNVKDSDFTLVPPGFEGPNGTLEIHTEIRDMNLQGDGVFVRAGVSAPDRPMSTGEIEASPGATGAFPAGSFFDVFVEVDLPMLGGTAPTVTLHNTLPLVVENSGIECFPPHVVYMHSHTGPVPVVFKSDDQAGSRWLAGDRLGWLVLAGHGIDFDTLGALAAAKSRRSGDRVLTDPFAEFQQIMASMPEMADVTTLNVDSRDIIHYADPGAFTQPEFRDSLDNGLVNAAALAQAGDLCGALALAVQLHRRVDIGANPPDWISDPILRQSFAAKLEELIAADLDSAMQHGGCPLTTGVSTPEAPGLISIVGIHPNPSLGLTSIGFALPRPSRVVLAIYDLSGRKIRTLVDAEKPAGVHWAIWEGSIAGGLRAPSGTYFVRLTVGGIMETRRLVILN